MSKLATLVAVCLFAGVTPALGAPQSDWDDCDQTRDLNRRVTGCTNVVNDGTESAIDRAEALIKRGNANASLNKIDAAISDYTAAIKLDPKNATAYFARARAYW